MKLLIATVALATVIAAPAFAQTAGHKARAEHTQAVRGANQTDQYGRTENGQRHSTNPANDVYDSRGYVGSDPDPRVREVLINERGGY
jgi:hypothetical protein